MTPKTASWLSTKCWVGPEVICSLRRENIVLLILLQLHSFTVTFPWPYSAPKLSFPQCPCHLVPFKALPAAHLATPSVNPSFFAAAPSFSLSWLKVTRTFRHIRLPHPSENQSPLYFTLQVKFGKKRLYLRALIIYFFLKL